MFGYSDSIEWADFSEREQAIIQALPHGSGINRDWHVTRKDKRIIAHNSYQVMNDMGYYVGYADFSIRWTIGKEADFRLMFHGRRAQYLAQYYNLREYLDDTLHYSLTKQG